MASAQVEDQTIIEAATAAAAKEPQGPPPSWWWDYASRHAPDHNEMYYLKFTLLSIALQFALHLLIHFIAYKRTHVYRELTVAKKAEYRCYITSPIHAVGCVILSTIAMFYICGEGRTVFNSDECMNTVRYVHIWALLHTCGYFLVDFFFLFFVIKGTSALDYQTYAHHIVAVVTFY